MSTSPIPSLTTPTSIFKQNDLISDRLNDFQNRYARFIRCQDGNLAQDDVRPECNSSDTFINVQRSYQSLLSSIQTLDKNIPLQKMDGTTNETSTKDHDDILQTYSQIRAQRKQLDDALQRLYSENNMSSGSSVQQLKQSMYANTLWVIFASCLIWYAVVEMK